MNATRRRTQRRNTPYARIDSMSTEENTPQPQPGLPWSDPNADILGDLHRATSNKDRPWPKPPMPPDPHALAYTPEVHKAARPISLPSMTNPAPNGQSFHRPIKAPSLLRLGDSPNIALDGPMKGDDLSSQLSANEQTRLILHSYDPRDTQAMHDFINKGGDSDPERPRPVMRVIDYLYERTEFGWTFRGARDNKPENLPPR